MPPQNKQYSLLRQAQMRRELGLASATAIVVASMIGTGIFTTTGFILEELTSPATVLLCWLVGGLFALCGAFCYAELGAMFPQAGGEYVFLRESLGRQIAFISGWISLIVGFSAPIAASSIACVSYLFNALQIVDTNTSTGLRSTSVALVIIALFSLVHFRGLSVGSKVQNALTALKLLIVLGLGVAGFLFGQGDVSNLTSEAHLGEVLSYPFAISLIFISFGYAGWNAATYLGAEVRVPSRNIPCALIGGTSIVIVSYILVNAVYFYALSPDRMKGVVDVAAIASTALFGEVSGRFVSAGVAVCILSVIGAMILTGPRVYYAMARDGLFFRRTARLSPRFGVPSAAILLQAVLAAVMAITATFDALLIYIGFTLSLSASLTVVGMIVMRFRIPKASRPYSTWGYPLTPLIFVAGNLWIMSVSIQMRPVACLFGLATIATGLVAYWYFRRASH